MERTNHRSCYGQILPPLLGLDVDRRISGKAVSFRVDSVGGLGRAGRLIDVNMDEWDACRQCEEFDHCYKLSMAAFAAAGAVAHE